MDGVTVPGPARNLESRGVDLIYGVDLNAYFYNVNTASLEAGEPVI